MVRESFNNPSQILEYFNTDCNLFIMLADRKRIRFQHRPIDINQKCNFMFEIHCNSCDNNWYLTTNKSGAPNLDLSMHNGHLKSKSEHISCSINDLDEEAIDMIMGLHECQQSPSTIASAITRLFGHNNNIFTPSQIHYVITRRTTEMACEDYNNLSSAEQLLQKFDNAKHDDVSKLQYIALIHSVEDGYKIKLPHGRPNKISNFNGDTNIDQIRESLRVNNHQDVLLAVAWTTEYERNMFKKFPELVTFDVTEKTNNQKRGLFMGTGLDGNGQLFPCIHVFMPNSQSSSYGWIYTHALPSLWGTSVIKNIEAIGTDGEHAMFSPLQNLINIGGDWDGVHLFR